jgi:beta-glucanase (GH16 family)
VECQEGAAFLDAYDFYDGADSLGSAGYNTYVSQKRAQQVGIVNITNDYVYMSSAPTTKGPRESIRLEGKKRYNRGLFLLDLEHMPAGPGVWPAWWLTDEDAWPNHGEIDIVEGINNQTLAKTALHTSAQCSMYAQVPSWSKTGTWDRAS